MKLWILCGCLLFAVAAYAAEADTSPQCHSQEPTLHDHYVAMKQMQERLAGRSLEEQAKLQPQIQRAQQKACARLQQRPSGANPERGVSPSGRRRIPGFFVGTRAMVRNSSLEPGSM